MEDTVEFVALYWRAGSIGKNTERRPTISDLKNPAGIAVIDCEWTQTNVLMIMHPGEAFSVYAMWQPEKWTLNCWYINLQESYCRTEIGFDTTDNMLDIVISPDMSQWQLKDEDELDEAERGGVYSTAEAEQIRQTGKKAIEILLGERRDFYGQWQHWSPPKDWIILELHSNWNKL